MKTFVAINDPVHSLIRKVTRHTPLTLCITPGELPMVAYRVRPEELPVAYYSLAVFHSLEGKSLAAARQPHNAVNPAERPVIPELVNYFDVVRLDRRCSRDLRLKLRKKGPGMLAAELLTYGTGVLRARNDDPLDWLHVNLWRRHGRIRSRHEVVHATIRALHWNSLPPSCRTQKESFDSTNVIYGDTMGELEQLWDRRADTVLLDQVTQSLQRMRKDAEVAAFLNPPLNLDEVIKFHLRAQALWLKPPATARVLLRRLEYILSHTIIDCGTSTVFRRGPGIHYKRHMRDRADGGWETDRSGYDGWLN
jgi:hypothetical protein